MKHPHPELIVDVLAWPVLAFISIFEWAEARMREDDMRRDKMLSEIEEGRKRRR